MSKPTVYLRADGSQTIGLGHVIRSSALANILKDDFDCTFFIRNPSEYLVNEIESNGCKVVKLAENISYQHEAEEWAKTLSGNEIVVLDGYSFDTDYQKAIKQKMCKLVCIDDIHAYKFTADVVINHAGGIAASDYQLAENTKLYLGPQYALLRPAFLNAAKHRKEIPDNSNVLICLGGADPKNDTLTVMRTAEKQNHNAHYHLVLGGAYGYHNELNHFLNTTKLNVQLYSQLTAEDMVTIMQQCPTAICSPSTVSFEYLSVGKTMYLLQIADNQERVNRYYLTERLAYPFSEFPNKPYSINSELVNQLFDGQQKERIVTIFSTL